LEDSLHAVEQVSVIIERGTKRAFASAVDWPGWSRSGKDEDAALAALLAYGPRYAKVARKMGFVPPTNASVLRVVERTGGNATTDFGAPGVPAKGDDVPVNSPDLIRMRELLIAGWTAFDDGVKKAKGKRLAKGPRGGGRSVAGIVEHVRDAEAGYLSALGAPLRSKARGQALTDATRKAAVDAMGASARGELPTKGPRGGIRWKARFYLRRDLWHILDHLWEIEDRST
jgi:hypothetical protein